MTLIELNLPCVHIEKLDRLTIAAKKSESAVGGDKLHIDHFIEIKAERTGLLQN